MHRFWLGLLLAAAIPASVAAAPSAGAPDKTDAPARACLDSGPGLTKEAGRAEVKRLGELPPGALVLTVLLEEDGCFRPLVIGRDFGATRRNDEAGDGLDRTRRRR